jgi:hypothetical protein
MSESDERQVAWDVMRPRVDPDEKLTAQQEHLVFLLASGVPPKAACKASGYASTSVLNNKRIKYALKYIGEERKDQIQVNRDKLTTMLYSAHANAANATEEIAAIRELGKMHDVYAQAQEDRKNNLHTAVQINNNTVQQLTDQDLEKIAQLTAGELGPERLEPPTEGEPIPIEGELVGLTGTDDSNSQ